MCRTMTRKSLIVLLIGGFSPSGGCDFASITSTAAQILAALRARAADGASDDLATGIQARSLDVFPLPMYTQYMSISGGVDDAPTRRLVFQHRNGSSLDNAIAHFCSGPDWADAHVDTSVCTDFLSTMADKHSGVREGTARTISLALEAFRQARLPPDIDLAEAAAEAAERLVVDCDRSSWRSSLHRELRAQALPPLEKVATVAGADLIHHGYQSLLGPLFSDEVRLSRARLLELGAGSLASAHMWRRFLPAAYFHSVDELYDVGCTPCRIDGLSGGVLGWRGSTNDPTFLSALVKSTGHFDLIIDGA